MERAFLATKESEYYKDLENYFKMVKEQNKFINNFFENNNIKAEQYRVGGDGRCNRHFEEDNKKDIHLHIIPTEDDIKLYDNQLTKSIEHGLCKFRSNSKIGKLFAQECIDNKVIINILSLDLRDYFKLDWLYGYSFQRVPSEKGYYLKISSDGLKEDDIPQGFIPIKLSDFYKIKEEYETKKGEK